MLKFKETSIGFLKDDKQINEQEVGCPFPDMTGCSSECYLMKRVTTSHFLCCCKTVIHWASDNVNFTARCCDFERIRQITDLHFKKSSWLSYG